MSPTAVGRLGGWDEPRIDCESLFVSSCQAKTNLSVPIGMLGSVVFVTIIYLLM